MKQNENNKIEAEVKGKENGKTVPDLISDIFSRKGLMIFFILAFITFIGLNVYAFSEAKKGREVKTLFFSVGEDPYLSENVNATCSAMLSTQNSIPLQTPTTSSETLLSTEEFNPPPSIEPTQSQDTKELGKDILNGCITDTWNEWPFQEISGKILGECIEYPLEGMVKSDDALKIFSNPNTEKLFGITTKLPDTPSKIQVNLQINKLSTNNIELATDLYIGFTNSQQKEINGEFINFHAFQSNTPPELIFEEYPFSGNARRILVNSIELDKEITIIFEKDILTHNIVILGFKEPIYINEIRNNNTLDSFFIGYKVPTQSTISALINNVQFSEK